MRPRRVALAAICACASIIGAASARPGSPQDEAEPASSHRRMLELLEEIREQTRIESTYLGTRPVDELRTQIEALRPGPNGPRRWQLNVSLGHELLRVGRTERAIEAFTAAVEQLSLIGDRLRAADVAETYFQLGTAYMRLGENQNCCLRHDKDSCILPIRGGGLHADTTGSDNAIVWFTKALEVAQAGSPVAIKARWLLNIAHMTLGGYPDRVPETHRIDPDVFASDQDFPRFVDVGVSVGLTETSLAGGMVVDDFDGDGRLDVVISTSDTAGHLRYYRNDGSGRLVDRSKDANFEGLFGGLNLTAGDYDNDGDLDLVVLRGAWWRAHGKHPKSLLQNDGHGVFTDVTFDVGLERSRHPSGTGAFADYDNDGDLDLLIGNESDPSSPAPCELYRNDVVEGVRRFVDVAARAGVTNDRYAKAVAWGDYDNDRDPDIYVSNMAAANRLYRNNGDGTFTDVAEQAGVTQPISCFPAWFFDYDNDGALDVFVAGYGSVAAPPSVADVAASYLGLPYEGERMRLYKGDGRGRFVDVAKDVGLTLYTLPMGSNFGDLDNDGYLDMYLGTGYPYYEGLIPNVMYRNQRGKRFADVTSAGGFGHLQKGHGVVFADLDDDGDQDVIEKIGGAFPGDAYRSVLFENPGFDAHWIKVRLVGAKSNRSGVGARIRVDVVEDGIARSIHKTVDTGGSFGCNPLRQELGVGRATKIARLEIHWPTTDVRQVFEDVAVDQSIVVREGEPRFEVVPLAPFAFAR